LPSPPNSLYPQRQLAGHFINFNDNDMEMAAVFAAILRPALVGIARRLFENRFGNW